MEHEKKTGAGEGVTPQEGRPSLADLESTKRDLEQQKTRAEQLLANWQRVSADLANFRRQVEKDREEVVKLSNSALVANILPVVDDLERAIDTIPESLRGLTWIDGMWLIYKKLQAVLSAFGISEIKTVGEKFDPFMHQAVDYAEGEDERVLEAVQKGYKIYDRVLRPALVRVGRRAAPSKEEQAPEAPSEHPAS